MFGRPSAGGIAPGVPPPVVGVADHHLPVRLRRVVPVALGRTAACRPLPPTKGRTESPRYAHGNGVDYSGI